MKILNKAFCAFVFLFLLINAASPPVFGQTQAVQKTNSVKIPDTPAGKVLSAWLQAFNDGDRKKLLQFFLESYAPAALSQRSAEDRALNEALFYRTAKGFELYDVKSISDYEIEALIRAKFTEGWLKIKYSLDPQTGKIARRGFMPAAASAGALPKGKLTDAQIKSELNSYLDKLAAEDIFSGNVLIVKNGRTIIEKSYGLANRGAKIPVTKNTQFSIGSMNKMFTGVAVAQLAQAGKLDFNAPVIKYLPDYPNKAIAEKITVHQLLTHTSGLGDFLFKKGVDEISRNARSSADYFPLFAGDELMFEPGKGWFYSNAGFLILGAIIEKLSGQSYGDYVAEHIFKPAGMRNSDVGYKFTKPSNLAKGYTEIGFDAQDKVVLKETDLNRGASAAGGGISTVEDILKFTDALRKNKLLNRKFTEIVMTKKTATTRGHDYAYGFGTEMINGKQIVGHGGDFIGVSTRFEFYPEDGCVVIVFSNYEGIAQDVLGKTRELITSN
jgi:CubicO group peptidase (beta-lactamase class C family)